MNFQAAPIRVGTLVPSHNNAGTIAEPLESIRRQDALGELTGICMADDGSMDDTIADVTRIRCGLRTILTVVTSAFQTRITTSSMTFGPASAHDCSITPRHPCLP